LPGYGSNDVVDRLPTASIKLSAIEESRQRRTAAKACYFQEFLATEAGALEVEAIAHDEPLSRAGFAGDSRL